MAAKKKTTPTITTNYGASGWTIDGAPVSFNEYRAHAIEEERKAALAELKQAATEAAE